MNEYLTIDELEIMTEGSKTLKEFKSIMDFPYTFQIRDNKTRELKNYEPVLFYEQSGIVQLIPRSKDVSVYVSMQTQAYFEKKFHESNEWHYRQSNENNVSFCKLGNYKKEELDTHLIIWHKNVKLKSLP